MKFFVTVYINDVLPGDVLTVKIGLVMDTLSVGTADVTITVGAAGTLPTGGAVPTIDTVSDFIYVCLFGKSLTIVQNSGKKRGYYNYTKSSTVHLHINTGMIDGYTTYRRLN